LKLLFIGDIVGKPGRRAVDKYLKQCKEEFDVIIANGENVAGGTGMTKKVCEELFSYGIHVLTSGNHVWDKKEIFDFIDDEKRILRPINYPEGTPGIGYNIYEINGYVVGVINALGRVFMLPLSCPFITIKEQVEKIKKHTNIIIVDFHAEATSEKIAMGYYLSGKVSAVIGTHTHIQTADERILSGKTAYITDVGMTGAFDSVLGVRKNEVIKKFLTQLPQRFSVAKEGGIMINAVILEIDVESGAAQSIVRVNEKTPKG